MTLPQDREIVVIDDSEDFLAEAKRVFEGSATTFTSFADAQRRVESGDVDLVILGPSHAHEAGLKTHSMLLEIDQDIPMILVAGTITAPLLKAALRYGLKDVVEAP
ncbi:MAG: response regulator, partial [Acidimicrobiia bacterium]|nr:response regulator [Acidimicrobiia bacterium]